MEVNQRQRKTYSLEDKLFIIGVMNADEVDWDLWIKFRKKKYYEPIKYFQIKLQVC